MHITQLATDLCPGDPDHTMKLQHTSTNRTPAIPLVRWLSSSALFFALAFCPPLSTAQAASGDEHWDYQFGPPGADDTVYVVAPIGDDLYVGGQFSSLG